MHHIPVYFLSCQIYLGFSLKKKKSSAAANGISSEALKLQISPEQFQEEKVLCVDQRHRCIEQSFGLCGRGRGWDDLGEWH